MRIAFYAPLKSPRHPTPSGDRRVARLLWQALEQAGCTLQLASESRSLDLLGDAAHQRALQAEGEAIAQALIAQWSGLQATQRPQLWFTYHLYYKAPDWIGPAVCAALDIPYVVFEASHAPKRAEGAWAWNHAAVERAIAAADLLLSPTRDDMACLRGVAHAAAPVLQLPPFLDPAPYGQAARERASHRAALAAACGLDPRAPWIIVAAMMRTGDKLASYLQVARTLERLPDLPWQLLVAGDGPARAQVQAALQAAAPARTAFLGQLDASGMAAAYAACDVCLWPAVNEAYGMALLEAQAAGLPVVSCRLRGVPDVVAEGRTGLLVPGGDVQALADALHRLLAEAPLRQQLGAQASHFVAGERSVAQAAARLQQVLPRRRLPRPLTPLLVPGTPEQMP